MQLSQVVICISSCIIVLLGLNALESFLNNSSTSCTVILTGESVKIVGCEFSLSFIEYAKLCELQRIGDL
uniref:Movement protein TGBp3 n=1 Tax=Pea streak virus TaxID=157777 RepID=F4YRJ9_9VIRU|nr:TGB3 [Pea streak virus]